MYTSYNRKIADCGDPPVILEDRMEPQLDSQVFFTKGLSLLLSTFDFETG